MFDIQENLKNLPDCPGVYMHKDKLGSMSDEEVYALLATDGMLVKRPILVGDDFVLTGFKEAEWSERLGK